MSRRSTIGRSSQFIRLFPATGFLAGLLLLGLAAGCASIRTGLPSEDSHAFAHPETTRLGRDLADAEREHPGQSGFALLAFDLEALMARAALADAAQRSLDVQYYIYDDDEAGSIFAEHLLQAADRGVRVRLLLDDFHLRDDRELTALCAHPRIQVRVFNPIRWRAHWLRLPQYVLDFHRVDRRMHNKLFIADGAISILGGRNIGDEYFSLNTRGGAFRDFDLLAAGPVAKQASAAFDEYWNSPWCVNAVALAARAPTAEDLAWARRRIRARLRSEGDFESHYPASRAPYLANLMHESHALVWAPAEVVAEPPGKMDGASAATALVSERLDQEWNRARKEILIEAAYFVPGRDGVRTFRDLCQRGVSVKVLTSGADATDVPMVYGAYRKYRRALLDAGVDLYEFRYHPKGDRTGLRWYRLRSSFAALHSKVIVFDRQRVWAGSFNLDPRSARLNTEIAIVVDSPQLAAQLAADLAGDMAPDRSWRVSLEDRSPGSFWAHGYGAKKSMVWTGEQEGRMVTLHREPVPAWTRFGVDLWSLLPGLEGEL